MSDIPTDPAPQDGIDFGALAHATAGISAVVVGGMMYTRAWAQDVFFDSDDRCSGQCDVLFLEAYGLGNGSLVSDGVGAGCHSGLYVMAVGLYPRLRDFVDRFYPLCCSGCAVAACR